MLSESPTVGVQISGTEKFLYQQLQCSSSRAEHSKDEIAKVILCRCLLAVYEQRVRHRDRTNPTPAKYVREVDYGLDIVPENAN